MLRPFNRYRSTQELPATVLMQIRPVHQDDRHRLSNQPGNHRCIDRFALRLQMRVAEQAIQTLQRRTYALRTRPRSRHIHQDQPTRGEQGLHRVDQRAGSNDVHRANDARQTLLQYCQLLRAW